MTNKLRWIAIRIAALVAAAGAIALIWLHRGWFDPQAIDALIAHHPWAPFAFIAIHIVASLVFVPRSALSLAAGLVFGLWWGILWTTAGAMAGAWAGFGVARLLGGGMLDVSKSKRVKALVGRLERGGWRAVTAVRIVPVMPHTPVNYAFGLTNIGWGAYSIGTFLGLAPSTVFVVSIGAAGGKALTGGAANWLTPMLIGLAALAISLLLPKLPMLKRKA